jgi:hypothetical protein
MVSSPMVGSNDPRMFPWESATKILSGVIFGIIPVALTPVLVLVVVALRKEYRYIFDVLTPMYNSPVFRLMVTGYRLVIPFIRLLTC